MLGVRFGLSGVFGRFRTTLDNVAFGQSILLNAARETRRAAPNLSARPYGRKGAGKSSLALGWEGRRLCRAGKSG
jgi:hypothetical protein